MAIKVACPHLHTVPSHVDIVLYTLLNKLLGHKLLSGQLNGQKQRVVDQAHLLEIVDISLHDGDQMLVDLSETQVGRPLLLQLQEVQVLPISLGCDNALCFAAVSATFKVKLVAQELWVVQLHGVLHQTEDDWGHTLTFDGKDTEYL